MKTKLLFVVALLLSIGISAQDIQPVGCGSPIKAIKEKKDFNRKNQKLLPPINTRAYTQSIHNAIVKWDKGSYSSYRVGSTERAQDIQWQRRIEVADKHTGGDSYEDYRLSALSNQGGPSVFNIGDTFYITLDFGKTSEWVSPPLKFEWEDLGNPSNKINIKAELNYGLNGAQPYTIAQRDKMLEFLSKANTIIEDIYGPPSRKHDVFFVNDGKSKDFSTFFNGYNQIYSGHIILDKEIQTPRLMIHELVHAYRDNVLLSSNDKWHYDPTLSGFEEGMAEAVSIIVMDIFIGKYPGFFKEDKNKKHWSHAVGMGFDWNYDFQNHSQLTGTDFWSSDQATGVHWERYGTSQTAMQKMYMEDSELFKKFNTEYYKRLNADHTLVPSRALIIDIFKGILDKVEGVPVEQWINKQRVFDCKVVPGKKVHMLSFHNASQNRIHTIDNRTQPIITQNLPGGNEWSWIDPTTKERWYSQTNNLDGVLKIFNYDNSLHQSVNIRNNKTNIVIEYPGPNQGPIIVPETIDNHSFHATSSTERVHQDLPRHNKLNDPDSQIITGLTDLGLYKYEITFDGGQHKGTYYRLHGQDLVKKEGVTGGIKSVDDTNLITGKLIIEHEDFGEEPEISIDNGAFIAEREWTAVPETDPNRQAGRADRKYSIPGKVHAIYISEDCEQQKIDFRNIRYGDGLIGSQLFLFTVENFQDIEFESSDNVSICEGDNLELEVENNFPDILDGDSRITYKWTHPNGTEFTDPVHTITGATKAVDEGLYTLDITFFGCQLPTREINVSIGGEGFEVNIPDTVELCEGGTLDIEVNEIDQATYSWTGPDNFASDQKVISIPDMKGGRYVYTLVVSALDCDGAMIDKEATTVVTVKSSNFEIGLAAEETICEGDVLRLEANQLTGAAYSWVGPNGFTSKERRIQLTNFSMNQVGVYRVTVTAPDCNGDDASKSESITINVDPNGFDIETPDSVSVCVGKRLELGANFIEGASYSWVGPDGFTSTSQDIAIPNISGSDPKEYTVTVVAPGCNGSQITASKTTEVLVVTDSVEFTVVSPEELVRCEGGYLEIETNITPNATYSWTGPNGFTSDKRKIKITNVQSDQAGDYVVSVTILDCDDNPTDPKTSTTTVIVKKTNDAIDIETRDIDVCEGDEALLEVTDIGNAVYEWVGPNGFQATERTVSIEDIQVEQNGKYAVTVRYENCEGITKVQQGEINVSVGAVIEVDLSNMSKEGVLCVGGRDYVMDEAPDYENATYDWIGPNGFVSSERILRIDNVTSNHLGEYSLIVSVNSCGSEIREAHTINLNIDPVCKLAAAIPEFFTPNGDAINEYWVIDKEIIPFKHINIYNRHGKLLKQLNTNSIGWDGRYNGAQMPSSEYWYTAYLEDDTVKQGHFSLIR